MCAVGTLPFPHSRTGFWILLHTRARGTPGTASCSIPAVGFPLPLPGANDNAVTVTTGPWIVITQPLLSPSYCGDIHRQSHLSVVGFWGTHCVD